MKRAGQWALLWVLALATAGYLVFWPGGAVVTMGPVDSARPVLILDAGHGGEDGGAVSITGVAESQINLAITEKLDLLLGLFGEAPVVLRQADVSLHDPEADTLREKKASDLKNRAALVEGTEHGVLLSIHQNTFPDARYHGAQVFYAPTQGSQEFAVFTQQVLRQTLDPANERQAKPIPDSVYLMNHITCPAILVECGFLSNQEEEEKLRTEGYQRQLATALAGAWLQYKANFIA